LRFTQFYNTARCWPTRAALLTGYYAQQVRRDTVPDLISGGRGERPDWAPLLSARLHGAGYRCYHSGKWHLDGMPLKNGFDRSYYLRDQGRFFSPRKHYLDDKPLPAVERGSGFYGTTAIADHAVECLSNHAERHASQPFFHYVAFTAPHFPLHAKKEDIARYADTYTPGWKKIRDARYQRIKKATLVGADLSPVELEVGPPYHFPKALEQLGPGEVNRPLPWDELTAEQQTFQAQKMAIHAAMVDRMDREIGRIVDQLTAMSALDNTLILFLSDNGASAEIMVRDDGHDPTAAPGSAATYLCLGPGWSTAANTPFRRHKTWVHEGGVSTPLIAHWPQGIAQQGQLRTTPGHVVDITPTLLALAGVSAQHPDGAPSPPGQSLTPVFQADPPKSARELWWLHEGNRALRQGDWKLVAAKDDPWELYNLSTDRTETTNLATAHPEKVKALAKRWNQRWAQIQADAKNASSP